MQLELLLFHLFSLQSTIVLIRWHPAGSLAFVCGSGGEIQCFDLSLNYIRFQSLSEDPSPTLILPIASYLMYVNVHVQLYRTNCSVHPWSL